MANCLLEEENGWRLNNCSQEAGPMECDFEGVCGADPEATVVSVITNMIKDVIANFESYYNEAQGEKDIKVEFWDGKLELIEEQIIKYSARIKENQQKLLPA